MWKRIRNIFKVNSQIEESPSVMIQRAVYEMTLSIQDSSVAIKNAQVSQYEIQRKLDAYKSDAAKLHKEATDLVKKKKEQEAKQILTQKELIDKQVAQYEALNNNILQTISHLQFQQHQMKLKIDELQTKEVLLSAKLTNAKTQAEISQQLTELSQVTDLHFDQLEQDALQMETMTNVLNSLQTDSAEAEVDRLLGKPSKVEQLNSSFANLLSDIDKEERERQRLIDENKNKKVDLLFSQMKGGNVSGNVVSRDTDNSKAKEEKTKIDLDSFFKNTDNQVIKNAENIIDGFFSNTQSKVVREDSDNGKEEVKKEEPQKDDKQKLLDDFFK